MENIRNFSIISHVNHGKSTLADRFLELTKTIPKEKMSDQYLNSMDLESEKGITIKMHPIRMLYSLNAKPYILNLIDTPGHADFSYEVSRSLAAVEGAILLVDAAKGIQAQTIYNLELAKRQNLVIIPAINKIDMPQARTKETKAELANVLNVSEDDIFEISAKFGTNTESLLKSVIEKIPAPKGEGGKPFRALVFDSKYESFKGIIAYLRVIDGEISLGEKIFLMQAKAEGEVKETGYFKPDLVPCERLKSGEIGYLATGIKEPGKVRVGDTVIKMSDQLSRVQALPGYKTSEPVVFASIYPRNPDDYEDLREALFRLKLNDASFTFSPETKEALGRGFSCGFLGSLHAEIVSERLKREFGLDLVISTPSAVFKIINQKDQEFSVFSPSDWPNQSQIKKMKEPWVKLEVITPVQYFGQVSEALKELKGKFLETKYFGAEKMLLLLEVPLKGIVAGFYDKLKGCSQGFASMNYEILEDRPANLVKLEIIIAGRKEEALSKIVYEEDAFKEGKKMVEKLKEVLPFQMFSVSLQAAVGGQIIARETISAKRKDVTAPLYGGDYTRKRKLLEKQKKGKKELKQKGEVQIPPQVFFEIFKS